MTRIAALIPFLLSGSAALPPISVPDAQAGAGDLYRAFKQWCEQTGEPAQKQTWFGRRLAERGFEAVRSSNARLWKGVGLVTHDAFVRHDAL